MEKKKILVADDDEGIVESMTILLEDEGFEVYNRMKGIDIDDLIQESPDLIFLDIWMSGIDGRDVCLMIKNHKDTKNIPVVMFSANKDTREIAGQCGADDYLSKPFEIADLIRIAKKYTHQEVA